jgi:predicted nucleic acid-binding Zn ribbon protein
MRKSNTERVDAVIQQFMRLNGIETPYNQFRLIQAWPEVMDAQIQRYTGDIFIKNQTLHVQITSPAVKQNLLMQHRALARTLNEHVGAQVIEDIKFY